MTDDVQLDPLRGLWFLVRLGLLLAGAVAMMSSYTAATFGEDRLQTLDVVAAACFLLVALWDAVFLHRRWAAVRGGREKPVRFDTLDSGSVVVVLALLSAIPALGDVGSTQWRITVAVLAGSAVLVKLVTRRVFRVRRIPFRIRKGER